MTTCGVDGLV